MSDPDGIVLDNGRLRARVVDNAPRLVHFRDSVDPGLHGLGCLLHRDQNKNVFSACGLNYQVSNPRPAGGKGIASPRQAPILAERTGELSARLTHRGAEGNGLDTTLDYELRGEAVDQTITFAPSYDIEGFDAFFASYMSQPQDTSIYLRGRLQGDAALRWYEVASAGHVGPHGGDRIYYRTFDPTGKDWHQHRSDQPLRRQKRIADEESVAATLAAGFRMNEPNKCPFGGFYYAFIDDYVFLMIFREPEFYFWLSCSGGGTTRNPAWDYGIRCGAMRAGEKRSFHARLVFKRFAGVEDVLREVAEFRGPGAAPEIGAMFEGAKAAAAR
jgi:hypothetical protein